MLKSTPDGKPELSESKPCRWFDAGKYFQWNGNVLVNDKGEFLSVDESKEQGCLKKVQNLGVLKRVISKTQFS